MYQVVFTRRADKQFAKLPEKYRVEILDKILLLRARPYLGKKLQGEHTGKYSLKQWPYRIIYRIEKKRVTIVIVEIGHRQGIYK
ncbi:MAG: type II toxin-antitoxin system RelE/ParE family toxin [Patescibacteria group bacterium]